MLGVDRKQLGWQGRDDWGSHPQLAHQLQTNRFVTDLIAATLSDPGTGVSEWWPPAEAADHLSTRRRGRVLPDAGFYLETPRAARVLPRIGPCDRDAKAAGREAARLPARRGATVRGGQAAALHPHRRPRPSSADDDAPRLGPLRARAGAASEQRLDLQPRRKLAADRDQRQPAAGGRALGSGVGAPRREQRTARGADRSAGTRRHEAGRPEYGIGSALAQRSSRLLGAALAARRRQARRERGGRADHAAACGPRSRGVHRAAASAARRAAREARRDAAAFSSANSDQDLHSSALNGSMDDREDDVEEERWR
jgi:hypothetical protein